MTVPVAAAVALFALGAAGGFLAGYHWCGVVKRRRKERGAATAGC